MWLYMLFPQHMVTLFHQRGPLNRRPRFLGIAETTRNIIRYKKPGKQVYVKALNSQYRHQMHVTCLHLGLWELLSVYSRKCPRLALFDANGPSSQLPTSVHRYHQLKSAL